MDVTLYTRAGCHLCDEVKQTLLHARAKAAFTLHEIDIDTDPALIARYNHEVPVVLINGKKAFKYHLNEADFLRVLNAR
ncbi:MAG: glutaredoxin family protein [Candidatus Koribacter versatilis]|uniref:Glutaredoxin family protein n=1 Tax=Candidatus Korobacter versatilis TaxID=658062 RepID=A0A932EPL5_9BACT|nr:glutaredoxin family protein [Candidatus Koribacter versatilis]